MIKVAGYDDGFGNSKICIDNPDIGGFSAGSLKSVVTRPVSIGKATLGMKVSQPAMSIKFEDQLYYIGDNAWQWGRVLTNYDYGTLASQARKVLFFATLAKVLPPGDHIINLLVVGLPVRLLKETAQAAPVLKALTTYKGTHTFSVGKGAYSVEIKKIKVISQPVGAYSCWLLDENNRPITSKVDQEAAILDIGMNTLDLYVVKGDYVDPVKLGGDKVGVRRLLENLRKEGFGVEELDHELRSGRLKIPRSSLENWLYEIMGVVESIWPSLRRFAVVKPTGGGALLLKELLNPALISKGAAIDWPKDPILDNAIGLWKWGNHVLGS